MMHDYFENSKNLPFFEGDFSKNNEKEIEELRKECPQIGTPALAQSIPYLFFIRLLGICKEQIYNEQYQQLYLEGEEGKEHTQAFEISLKNFDYESILDFTEPKKRVNQLRNKLCESENRDANLKKLGIKNSNEQIKALKARINQCQNMEQCKEILKQISPQADKVLTRIIKDVENKPYSNIGQMLHIINSEYLKIRENTSFEQVKTNLRDLLTKFPQLLELPRIIAKNNNGNLYSYKFYKEVPDIGELYEEYFEALKKEIYEPIAKGVKEKEVNAEEKKSDEISKEVTSNDQEKEIDKQSQQKNQPKDEQILQPQQKVTEQSDVISEPKKQSLDDQQEQQLADSMKSLKLSDINQAEQK